MKTAISVEDGLIKDADRMAKRMGVSRSGLVSLALQEYLRQRRRDEMLDQLNRVYASDGGPEEKRMAPFIKAKFAKTIQDKW